MSLRALLVDDESPARRRLARLLGEVGGVVIVGEGGDGEDAVRLAETTPADVLFLDVRMPGMDGLAVAQRFADLPPIVFVTAYDEYAIGAFEVNAVDYLLKPVRIDRLRDTLDRVRGRAISGREAVTRALRATLPELASSARVVSTGRGEVRFFDARVICRFSAADKYTVFREGGAEHLTEEPLGALEDRLAQHGFVRVHRAELVRAAAIRALRSEQGAHELVLEDGQVARVSRRSLAAVRAALGLD